MAAGFCCSRGRRPRPRCCVTWSRAGVIAAGYRCRSPSSARFLDGQRSRALCGREGSRLVNEAARCVEEKVVDSPEDADYGMILGTGFAPFRGGPLRYAEHFGLNKVVDELERLAQSEEKFSPCEILKKHASDGTKFYEN